MSEATIPKTVDQIESGIESFEAAWARDGAPNLNDFLPSPGSAHYDHLLVELACIDLEFRWAAGGRPLVEEYLARFPALGRNSAGLQALAQQECQSRLDAGEAPPPAEYLRRLGVEISTARLRREPARSAARSEALPWRDRLAEVYYDYRRNDGEADPAEMSENRQPEGDWPELRPGIEVAGFRLVRELGRGTFGLVFLSEQPELAGRRVVLKLGRQLYDESQHLAQLQHTNIVPIYSAHRVGNLQLLCMPYLGSATLAGVLTANRSVPAGSRGSNALWSTFHQPAESTLAPGETREAPKRDSAGENDLAPGLEALYLLPRERAALTIAVGLARGLAHAHDRGIVHRDLKPANVLLADDGTPLLLDFNLAADLRGCAEERVLLGGTLPYMPPEQMAGLMLDEATSDGRGDIYAVGVILFEMLAGRHPFPSHQGTRRSVIDRMIADRRAGPPNLRQAAPGCSPAVAAIVRRCLAADPSQRYQRAQHLAEDLQRQLDDLPLKHTPEPSLVERTRKLIRRRPRLVGLIAAGVLTAIVGVVGVAAIGQSRRAARAERLVSRQQFTELLTDAKMLLGLPFPSPEELNEGQSLCLRALAMHGLPSATVWEATPAMKALEPAEQAAFQAELAEGLLLAARGAWLRAGLANQASEREREMALAKSLNAQAEQLSVDPASAIMQREYLFSGREKHPNSESLPAGLPEQTPDSPYAQGLWAGELASAGRFQDACRVLEDAIRSQPDNAAWWAQLGACQSALGRTRDAAASYSTCIALRPTLWRAYFWRGQTYLELKEYSSAVRDFDAALSAKAEHVPSLALRALAKLGLGEHEAAEADLTAAIQLEPDHTRLHFMRSRVRYLRKDDTGAQQDLAEGLKRRPADELSWIARGVARLPNDPAGALADFEAALKLNPWSREAAQNKAHVLAERLGQTEAAIAALDPIVERFPDYVIARIGRGVLLARLGRRVAARQDAEDSLRRDSRALVAYQAACVHALNSQTEPADAAEALVLLNRAVRNGFGADLVNGDPDLAALRDLPEFRRLVEWVGQSTSVSPTNLRGESKN